MKLLLAIAVMLAVTAITICVIRLKSPEPDKKPMATATVTTAGSLLVARDVPADPPAFKRIYEARLSVRPTVKLEIDAHTFIGTRMTYGTLTQADGKWITFEPESPADKILDPVILPEIRELCERILADDKAYVESKPKQFTDENRTVWVRQ